jgi:hypothetical protein
VHEFNPGILLDGLFWIVQVPDKALEIQGNTVTIRLENVPLTDNFFFLGPENVASGASFEMTYTRSGAPRQVRPLSSDPASPFNWAGEMWMATGSVTFSVSHTDGSFSAHGIANSSGMFGEMGAEVNGIFANQDR